MPSAPVYRHSTIRTVDATDADLAAVVHATPSVPADTATDWARLYWPILRRRAITAAAPVKPYQRPAAVAGFVQDVTLAVQGGLPKLGAMDAHHLACATARHLWQTVIRPHVQDKDAEEAMLIAALAVACPGP